MKRASPGLNRLIDAVSRRLACRAIRAIIRRIGKVAQLVEHRTENAGVGGSSPPLAIETTRFSATFVRFSDRVCKKCVRFQPAQFIQPLAAFTQDRREPPTTPLLFWLLRVSHRLQTSLCAVQRQRCTPVDSEVWFFRSSGTTEGRHNTDVEARSCRLSFPHDSAKGCDRDSLGRSRLNLKQRQAHEPDCREALPQDSGRSRGAASHLRRQAEDSPPPNRPLLGEVEAQVPQSPHRTFKGNHQSEGRPATRWQFSLARRSISSWFAAHCLSSSASSLTSCG